jgi:hypothetical protein
MNQGFKWKYDEMQDGDPTKQKDKMGKVVSEENYSTISYTRNICFVLQDGRHLFLNYGYLVSAEYLPEESKIILSFTSHIITVAGIYFEKLFYDLMVSFPRILICQDARYNVTNEKEIPVVNEITVISKSE